MRTIGDVDATAAAVARQLTQPTRAARQRASQAIAGSERPARATNRTHRDTTDGTDEGDSLSRRHADVSFRQGSGKERSWMNSSNDSRAARTPSK